jgi:hypothetical protein
METVLSLASTSTTFPDWLPAVEQLEEGIFLKMGLHFVSRRRAERGRVTSRIGEG